MDKSAYLAGVAELYSEEVFGEGLANRWLELASDRDERYKLDLFLQLESEAKVRLRPLLARCGLSLVEDEGRRTAGAEMAERFASLPWKTAMAELASLCRGFVPRYQALLNEAPPDDAPLVSFMVDHEQSFMRMAEREANGEGCMDRELLVKVAYPIARFR